MQGLQTVGLAVEAVQDWLETHGGEVRLTGPAANVSALADALCWSTRFLQTCGRLLPFLRHHGLVSDRPDIIVGMIRPGSAASSLGSLPADMP